MVPKEVNSAIINIESSVHISSTGNIMTNLSNLQFQTHKQFACHHTVKELSMESHSKPNKNYDNKRFYNSSVCFIINKSLGKIRCSQLNVWLRMNVCMAVLL